MNLRSGNFSGGWGGKQGCQNFWCSIPKQE
jgi:hypothetical protein